MSLDAPLFYLIPEQTARLAKAAFPNGNLFMHIRDELGPLYHNQDFAHLFVSRGRPAEAPARLALITVMQFVENLSDEQAADAVRDRLAWKYALALELDDPGFDASVLCVFRKRILAVPKSCSSPACSRCWLSATCSRPVASNAPIRPTFSRQSEPSIA